jgi:hypothetical protein
MRWKKLKWSFSTTTTYASPSVGAYEVLHSNNPALLDPNCLGAFLDCIHVVGLQRVTWSRCVNPTSGHVMTIRTVIRPNRKIPRRKRPHPKQQWTLRKRSQQTNLLPPVQPRRGYLAECFLCVRWLWDFAMNAMLTARQRLATNTKCYSTS